VRKNCRRLLISMCELYVLAGTKSYICHAYLLYCFCPCSQSRSVSPVMRRVTPPGQISLRQTPHRPVLPFPTRSSTRPSAQNWPSLKSARTDSTSTFSAASSPGKEPRGSASTKDRLHAWRGLPARCKLSIILRLPARTQGRIPRLAKPR